MTNDAGHQGIGECSIIEKLSLDDPDKIEACLQYIVKQVTSISEVASLTLSLPALSFGVETAFHELNSARRGILFPSDFTEGKTGIPINGLIWMGEKQFMFDQIKNKIEQGYSCIKLKIGAIDFQEEISLLKYIRVQFPKEDIELRVDANGAFDLDTVSEKLNTLADFQLHSIEQPIKQGQWNEMAKLCTTSPLDIALDEELIGVQSLEKKMALLKTIQPQYIILKPSLVGGLQSSDEWIELAESHNIGWWATSALESNIGLNAIAQWVATKQTSMPQGLGTGLLFTNNIKSPLNLQGEFLFYDPNQNWDPIF